jgi:prolyl oligopeptidase
MRLISSVIALFFIGMMVALVAMTSDAQISYPETRRMDHVDTYHGVEVKDPYRWLEDDVRSSEEVAEWVEAQNKVTFDYLAKIPERERIKRRLTEIWNFEKYDAPFKQGGRYYYYRNDGLQNQWVLYTMDSLDAKPRVLIDPNKWSEDGTIAMAGTSFSDDGKYITYGISESGSDWQTWRVMEIETGRVLDDELKWVKYTAGASWTRDSKGFFYRRYDKPREEEQFQAVSVSQKLYYHRVGTPQSEDILVYQRPDQPEWTFFPKVTEDGKYLVIMIFKGTDNKNRVVYRDLDEPYGMPVDLIDNFDNLFDLLGNNGPVFFFDTDLDAPKRRVISIDIQKPDRENWKEVIPEAEETLDSGSLVANMFVAQYLKDVKTQVKIYSMDGEFIREVDFPAIGSASGFDGRRTDTETFYSFSSFATPPSIYRYDMITGKSKLFHQVKVAFIPDAYEVKQVFYPSKDGTRIPMFITHKKGIKFDGTNPTLLFGYGGFSIAVTPRFDITIPAWMEMGGVLAVANLRGGGEYGEEWHEAGKKLNKQNVFDDFIAAAEWLISNRYTRSEKLAIQGGSNGGLLVGAVMAQRPELFGACLPAVGVMDMLRFHKFTAGVFWIDEFGSSDNPEEFEALLSYSPYHNIRKGVKYPATLITTADTDDRVVPGHSFKFAAALQYAQAGDAPVPIRIETRAGHGRGKPTSMVIEETSDMWAFLVKNLDMTLPQEW